MGTSKKIVGKLENLTESDLSKIHRLMYGTNGIKSDRKTNIFAFSGLDQSDPDYEKTKLRITNNITKNKTEDERNTMKDVFFLSSADVDEIVNFFIEPKRPEGDEELEFKDDVLDKILNQMEEDEVDDKFGFDVSGDEGDVYDPDAEEEEEEEFYEEETPKKKATKSKAPKSTKSSKKSAKGKSKKLAKK